MEVVGFFVFSQASTTWLCFDYSLNGIITVFFFDYSYIRHHVLKQLVVVTEVGLICSALHLREPSAAVFQNPFVVQLFCFIRKLLLADPKKVSVSWFSK